MIKGRGGMFDANKGTNKNPYEKDNALADIPPGIYLGKVIASLSNDRDGSIRVVLDKFTPNPLSPTSKGITVQYASPFYGNANLESSGDEPDEAKKPLTSYGMWMQAPEVGNRVLVAVADGNIKHAFIVGYLSKHTKNKMVPGLQSDLTYQGGPFLLPTVEKQPKDSGPVNNKELYPVNHPLAKAIVSQGLALDPLRGISASGARRDDQSNVFGILTKGRFSEDHTYTHAGHSIVMDDGDTNGQSKNIRIRTGGGNQILLDDDSGSIYLINKSGKAWVEMASDGSINFFSEGDLSFRAKNNFNLRADRNINIEAGWDVNVMAAGDNDKDGYKGRGGIAGVLGLDDTGFGHIKLQSKGSTSILSEKSAMITAQAGDLEFSSSGRIMNDTGKFDVIANNIANPALGGVSIVTTGSASIGSALGSSILSGAITEVRGATVQLNSLPAVPPPPPLPERAQAATPLQFTAQQDQSSKAPEYDDSGEGNILPTGGARPEKGDNIETIVGKLITAEPYSGHVQYEPQGDEDDESKTEDTSTDKELKDGQIAPDDSRPADVDTPEGTKLGETFDKASQVKDKISGALDKGRAAYSDIMNNPISQFLQAGQLNLNSLESGKKLASMLGITLPKLPSLPFQAQIDAMKAKVKQFTNFDFLKGQFSLDFLDGLPADLKSNMAKLDLGNIEDSIKGSLGDKFGATGDAFNNFKSSVGKNVDAFNDAKAQFDKIKGGG